MWMCVSLTEQRLNDDSVEGGVAVRLPLGAHAATEHLVRAEIVHPQEHCERKKKTDICKKKKNI